MLDFLTNVMYYQLIILIFQTEHLQIQLRLTLTELSRQLSRLKMQVIQLLMVLQL